MIPGLSPQGPPSSGGPPAEGRAAHAREGGIAFTDPYHRYAIGPSSSDRVGKECLGIRMAVPSGRGDRAPPREPPLHIIPGFSPKGLSPRLAPRGGAGSARPRGRRGVDRGMCPVGHGPLASSSGGRRTLGHSDGGATRAHRVHPSEKDPHIAMLPGWRANPCNWLLAPQAEGRALQARYRTLAPDRDMSLLRSRPLRVTRNWRNASERVQAYRPDVRSVSILQIRA